MAMVKEKVERRLGEKLFLKGERCSGPKCAQVRRAYPPGVHGKTKSRRRQRGSEYGTLLKEKQRVRYLYGLDEKDVFHYSKTAVSQQGVFHANFLRLLESRLDSVLFRLGFAPSRRSARQFVNHGHIQVNGRRVDIASCQLKRGDIVSIMERSRAMPVFAHLGEHLKKYVPPRWLELDTAQRTGKIVASPEFEALELPIDPTKIREFYSR